MNQITYEKRVEVYKEALKQNGMKGQMIVALEEMSEIQKEICKMLRGKGNLDHLAEEIADATIMLEQLRLMHYINDLVCMKMDEKVQRLAKDLKMEIPDEKGMEAESTKMDGIWKEVGRRLYWKPDFLLGSNDKCWTLTCQACGSMGNHAENDRYCPNCGVEFDGPPEVPDEWKQEQREAD